jgi:hypothetical protein
MARLKVAGIVDQWYISNFKLIPCQGISITILMPHFDSGVRSVTSKSRTHSVHLRALIPYILPLLNSVSILRVTELVMVCKMEMLVLTMQYLRHLYSRWRFLNES